MMGTLMFILWCILIGANIILTTIFSDIDVKTFVTENHEGTFFLLITTAPAYFIIILILVIYKKVRKHE